jgi:transposase InsO family protein
MNGVPKERYTKELREEAARLVEAVGESGASRRLSIPLKSLANLLGQRFATEAPDQVWAGDLTYIVTDDGGLYLARLKDLYSGEIVGYTMDEHMARQLVMRALFRAVSLRRPPPGLIQHTDRGSPVLLA